MDVNAKQKTIIVPKMEAYYNGNMQGMKIALWGLAFKPDTDDIREAPALYIIEELLQRGAEICAFDPEAMDNVKSRVGDRISYANDAYEAIDGADCLLIATEWSVFRNPDFDRMSKLLLHKVIFDGRNLYELPHMQQLGYDYFSIGREEVRSQQPVNS